MYLNDACLVVRQHHSHHDGVGAYSCNDIHCFDPATSLIDGYVCDICKQSETKQDNQRGQTLARYDELGSDHQLIHKHML